SPSFHALQHRRGQAHHPHFGMPCRLYMHRDSAPFGKGIGDDLVVFPIQADALGNAIAQVLYAGADLGNRGGIGNRAGHSHKSTPRPPCGKGGKTTRALPEYDGRTLRCVFANACSPRSDLWRRTCAVPIASRETSSRPWPGIWTAASSAASAATSFGLTIPVSAAPVPGAGS